MSEYDLSTDAGRMRALLDCTEESGRVLRKSNLTAVRTFRMSSSGTLQELSNDGRTFVDHDLMPLDGTCDWSIVEPGPKPVEELGPSQLERELGIRPGHYTENLRRLVTEQRARKAKAARDAGLEGMTVGELAVKYWPGASFADWDHCGQCGAQLIGDTFKVAYVWGETCQEARENLRTCLIALAKRKEVE